MTDIRTSILSGLSTLLDSISVAGSYNTNVGTVEIGESDPGDIAPSSSVWIGIIPERAIASERMGYIEYNYEINITAHQFVTTATTVANGAACDNIRRDIRKAIYSSPTLGVSGVVLTRINWDETTNGSKQAAMDHVATVLVNISVIYEESISG